MHICSNLQGQLTKARKHGIWPIKWVYMYYWFHNDRWQCPDTEWIETTNVQVATTHYEMRLQQNAAKLGTMWFCLGTAFFNALKHLQCKYVSQHFTHIYASTHVTTQCDCHSLCVCVCVCACVCLCVLVYTPLSQSVNTVQVLTSHKSAQHW